MCGGKYSSDCLGSPRAAQLGAVNCVFSGSRCVKFFSHFLSFFV